MARWYGRRLKYLWITSVTEGFGFFVAYALLVVVGAVWGRQSIVLRHDDEKRLDSFLQSDHLVRDDDRFVSALSVVLSALPEDQRIKQGGCPAESGKCRRARNVLAASVQFAQLIGEQKPADPKEIATILASNSLPREAAALVLGAVNHGVEMLSPTQGTSAETTAPEPDATGIPKSIEVTNTFTSRCDYGIGPPKAPEDEKSPRGQFLLVDARCERSPSDVSGLQIPEQIADLVPAYAPQTNLVASRIHHAIGVSFALEAALRAGIGQFSRSDGDQCGCCGSAQSEKKCTDDLETHSFTAAYFVGVDSVLRYWREETVDPVKRLPKNILWAARDYFTTYLRGDTLVTDEYVSQPYVDIAGAGIVQTICRAVPTAMPQQVPIIDRKLPPRMIIAGVVCADLALRPRAVKSLVGLIQRGPLVSAGLLRIHPNGDGLVEAEPNQGPMDDLRSLVNSVQWGDNFTSQWSSGPASRGTTRLQVDSQIWYVVPIARASADVLAIAIHPAPSTGVGRLSRWAIVGALCGAALVLLTITAQQSRRIAIAGRDLARLRGLPAAVVECRPDPIAPNSFARQAIVAGNDRAEEVLQIRLPNFGLAAGESLRLGSIFDETKLICAGRDGVEPQKTTISEAALCAGRRRGDISTYYARLKEPRMVWQLPLKEQDAQPQEFSWVRVVAGPVILPRWHASSLDARGRLESTLGILMPVFDDKLGKTLDDTAQLHKA